MKHLMERANLQQGTDQALIQQLMQHQQASQTEMDNLYEESNAIYSQSLNHEQYSQQLQHRLNTTEQLLSQQIQMGTSLAERAEHNLREAEINAQQQAEQSRRVEDSSQQAHQANMQYQQQVNAEFRVKQERENLLTR